MRIQHNIMAMNAYRNYNTNTSALSKNLEKLSSGYKINRAGDDAAGLAISEKMRAQITGLNAATKNVKDGISLVKTAEGAMQEIQDMLNRMDYLATQSANGTYDDPVDRDNLNKEMDALKKEINRIADSANFNGIKLLDGSLKTTSTTENIGDGKAAIVSDYLVDESKDGIEPTAAKAAKYTVELAGLDTTQEATVADVKANNATVNAAAADTKANYQTGAFTNATAVGAFKVTVAYTDEDGATQTREVSVTASTTTAATTAGEIKAAIEADDVLKDLFDVAVNNTSALKFESKTAGSGEAYVTGITVTEDTGSTGAAFAVPAADALTKAVDQGSYDLSKFGTNTADTITVNGKAYTAANFAALKTALEADGFEVTGNTDGTNTKIMGAQVTSKIGGNDITGGTTTIAQLGAQQIDGKNIKDQFKVSIDGTEVTDWTSTDAIAAGAEITFEAKIPGKVSTAVENAFKTGATGVDKATVTVDQVGINEDSAGEATKAKYELTFTFDNLAGNQRVKVGDKIYELSTSGTKADPNSSNVLVDLRGMDPTTDAGKQAIATAIHTAISNGLGNTFTSSAPTVAAGADDVTMSFEAVAGGSAGNKGNIQVFDNPAAVTGTYTAGKEAANKDAARPTSVVYAVDLNKLAVGDKITLGSGSTAKTVEIVANDKADPGTGKITLADAKNATKLTEAFYAQGYDQVVSIANGKMTISAAKQTAGGGTTSDTAKQTAEQFAASAGKVVFTSSTPTTKTTVTGDPLELQIGDTSDTFNRLEVSIGDMHVDAMGTGKATVDGQEVEITDTIATIHIKDQAHAQSAVNVIKNAINYVSGVRGDLGAIQNRLEHTANNLSVMRENIQDAESTIRDTDIAEEMMAYTKNNILVQSAQAMLAQANAVPQGVLQLLG